jgi:hypothetical protein
MKRMMTLGLAAAVALSACARVQANEATGQTDVDIESPLKKGEDWKGALKGMGNFTTVVGQVKATSVEGKTEARISIEGATAGGSHPWLIHEGSCNLPGNAIGSASDYPALTIGQDGKGNAVANLARRLDEAKDYIVIVHASASDMSTVVACGDLDD